MAYTSVNMEFDSEELRIGYQSMTTPATTYDYNMKTRAFTKLKQQEVLGGFDPALGAGTLAMGGDDLAAFFEMVAAGYTLVYEPAAIVYHRHRSDYADLQHQIYGYGVGLSAFLTHCLLKRPGRLLDVARKTPRGLAYLFSTRSPKNTRKAADYPAELTRLERRGFVAGPLAYLRSRRQVGRSTPGLPIMEPTTP